MFKAHILLSICQVLFFLKCIFDLLKYHYLILSKSTQVVMIYENND